MVGHSVTRKMQVVRSHPQLPYRSAAAGIADTRHGTGKVPEPLSQLAVMGL